MFDILTQTQSNLPPPDAAAQTKYIKHWRQMIRHPEGSAVFDTGWHGVLELESRYHFGSDLLHTLRKKAKAK